MAEFEPVAGEVRFVDADRWKLLHGKIHGLWDTLGAIFSCLYLWEGSLYLRLDSESMPLDHAVVQFERRNSESQLIVDEHSDRQFLIEYPAPRDPSDVSEWPVEIQDYDFGAWISWVANDPTRQAQLKLNWLSQEVIEPGADV